MSSLDNAVCMPKSYGVSPTPARCPDSACAPRPGDPARFRRSSAMRAPARSVRRPLEPPQTDNVAHRPWAELSTMGCRAYAPNELEAVSGYPCAGMATCRARSARQHGACFFEPADQPNVAGAQNEQSNVGRSVRRCDGESLETMKCERVPAATAHHLNVVSDYDMTLWHAARMMARQPSGRWK